MRQCGRGLSFGSMGLAVLLALAGVLLAAADETAAQTVGASAPKADKRIKRDFFYEPEPLDFNDHAGYVQIFDGVTLKNWDGDPAIWRVEKGAMVGESTREK